MSDATEAFRLRLSAMLRAALTARDSDTVRVLRGVMAALDNAGAISEEDAAEHVAASITEVPRRELSEPQIEGILRAEVEARHEASDTYERVGRTAEALQLRREIETIEGLRTLLGPTD